MTYQGLYDIVIIYNLHIFLIMINEDCLLHYLCDWYLQVVLVNSWDGCANTLSLRERFELTTYFNITIPNAIGLFLNMLIISNNKSGNQFWC